MPITSKQTTKKPALGRSSGRQQMTKLQAKKQAAYLVSSNKLSPDRQMLIEYLAVCGCLTTYQIKHKLDIGLRTLQRCFYDSKTEEGHILDYHRGDPELIEYGFTKTKELKHIRVWVLGILGRAIATELGYRPISYSGFSIRQLTHDLLCNAIVQIMINNAEDFGYSWEWLGKNEARIIIDRKAVIEPDALLIFKRNGKTFAYCLELHNEKGGTRAKDKHKRYVQINRDSHYEKWGLEFMPTIAVFGHSTAILKGYTKAIASTHTYSVSAIFRTILKTLENQLSQGVVDINDYANKCKVDREVNFDLDVNFRWVYFLPPP